MKLNRRTTAAVCALALIGLVAPPAIGDTSVSPPLSQAVTAQKTKSKLPDLPAPKSYFGFEMGDEGKLASFAQIKSYFKLMAKQSDEVDYAVAGKTSFNNDYPILHVSNKKNLDRLDEILDINKRLADPRKMKQEAKKAGVEQDAYARSLAKTTVPVYYIEATVHSTEVGNTQALVDIVHRLATEKSEEIDTILENTVVLVVPSANPDGQKLVVDYFNKTAGTDYNRVYPDLYHRYAGHDNNRDWFMFTQKESQTRVKLEQKYRPVVQHYMHQAGQSSPRLWSPPYDEPLSTAVDPIAISSSNALGLETQKDLVAEGLKGTQSDDKYGILWNADVAGFGTFLGTSTYLTEIAAAKDLAYTYTSDKVLEPSEKTMRTPLPYDSKSWSLKQIVHYATSATFSGLNTVAKDNQSWLFNNLYRVNQNSLTWKDGAYAYVIPKEQRDPYAVYDMMKIFDFGQVEIEKATSAFTAGGKQYDKGAYIMRTQQPLGRWVDQLLRIDVYPDNARKCSNGCPLILPYSETTDNLALFMGVESVAVKDAFKAETKMVESISQKKIRVPKSPGKKGAYVLSPSSYGLGMVIDTLQDAGVDTYRASSAIKVEGKKLAPGAILIPSDTKRARRALLSATRKAELPVYAVSKVPKTAGIKLQKNTRIGLIRGANNMPGGWMTWMMDEFGTNYKVVEAKDYKRLTRKFDTVILAPGVSAKSITEGLDPKKYPDQFDWAAGVPDGLKQLKRFVRRGGNLVALGSASQTATEALSLPVKNVAPKDRDAFTVPGALLKQDYDVSAPAAWGMPESWPTWYNNDAAFELTGEGTSVSTYPNEDDLLVSGYAKNSKAIAGTTNIASFDHGKGHVTIAGGHITFRTWPRASWTVVTNAMYNGAGTELTRKEMGGVFK